MRSATALTISLTASLLIAGCREQPTTTIAAVTPVQSVTLATPRAVEMQAPVKVLGRLEAADELRLSFKSAGVIGTLNVDIGDHVAAGQVLAELETTELDAALSRATSALTKAERDADRARELQTRALVSREALDNALTARDMAAAELRTAGFNRRHAQIVAPAAGRVLTRLAKAREMVAAGAPVLTVSSETNGWLLRVDVADRDVTLIREAGGAVLGFDALPGERFAARISRIAASADAATGTFEVELMLEEADPRLRSGMIGRARIATESHGETLLVPVAALIDTDGLNGSLYIVMDGHARLRTVRLGRLAGSDIAVTGGLAASDAVIIAGAAYVDDGAAVRAWQDRG